MSIYTVTESQLIFCSPVALTLSSVIGAVVIITVVEHFFSMAFRYLISLTQTKQKTVVIVVVVVFLGYQHFQSFYRASAREVKRLG